MPSVNINWLSESRTVEASTEGIEVCLYVDDDKTDPFNRTVAGLRVGGLLHFTTTAVGPGGAEAVMATLIAVAIQHHAEIRDALAEKT